MIEAVLALLTLGSGHYVAHCRNAPEGCRARVTEYVHWAEEAAELHGIDPRLMMAIAVKESGVNPNARGKIGEVGVYQLHPKGSGARAARMCRLGKYPLGWCHSYVAAQVLAEGLKECGEIGLAIGYYNTGKCLSGPYVARVRAVMAKL